MEEIRRIDKKLSEAHLYAEIYEHAPFVYVDIEHGDWKHDHMRCDYLMKQLGYRAIDEKVTYADGSDNYSATHVYVKETNL